MKDKLKTAYIVATLIGGVFVSAHHLGRKAGIEETTAKVNTVLQHQYETSSIGGTWDAVAETLNGQP